MANNRLNRSTSNSSRSNSFNNNSNSNSNPRLNRWSDRNSERLISIRNNTNVRDGPLTRISRSIVNLFYLSPPKRSDENHQNPKRSSSALAVLLRSFIKPLLRLGLGHRASWLMLSLILMGLVDLFHRQNNSQSIDRDDGPTRAGIIKTRSQLDRLREKMRQRPFEVLDSLDVLPDLQSRKNNNNNDRDGIGDDKLGLNGRWLRPINSSLTFYDQRGSIEPDVTAVILNWHRLENVIVIVSHVCRYDFIESVLVWNNDPEQRLTREDFKSTECPTHKLKIYNAPSNQYFFARYLACLQSSSKFCFFQDDDCIVKPIRTMYHQFKSLQPDEGLVVVQSDPTYSVMYHWEWCFRDQPGRLNTCFAWLGHGSFVSKSAVSKFVESISHQSLASDLIALSDNFFTTSLNREPKVIVNSEIIELTLNPKDGFSDGRLGLERNRVYIQKGIERLSYQLDKGIQMRLDQKSDMNSSSSSSAENFEFEIKTNEKNDRYYLVSNLKSFPEDEEKPNFMNFESDELNDLNDWEDSLGNTGLKLGRIKKKSKSKNVKNKKKIGREEEVEGDENGSEESEKVDGERRRRGWIEMEIDVIEFGEYASMDNNLETFWRPNKPLKKDDYIGIGLIDKIIPEANKASSIEFKMIISNPKRLIRDSILETLIKTNKDYFKWIRVDPSHRKIKNQLDDQKLERKNLNSNNNNHDENNEEEGSRKIKSTGDHPEEGRDQSKLNKRLDLKTYNSGWDCEVFDKEHRSFGKYNQKFKSQDNGRNKKKNKSFFKKFSEADEGEDDEERKVSGGGDLKKYLCEALIDEFNLGIRIRKDSIGDDYYYGDSDNDDYGKFKVWEIWIE